MEGNEDDDMIDDENGYDNGRREGSDKSHDKDIEDAVTGLVTI